MSTARVLLKQGSTVYRFLRFETASDGSLIVFLDRDARSKFGSFDLTNQGDLTSDVPKNDRPLPSGRFSIHTSGIIHRYAAGKRKSTIQIEPLYALSKVEVVGFFSIPRISGLDCLDNAKHRNDSVATLEFPERMSERITFVLEIGPKPQQPATFGVALNYELYSSIVRLVPNPTFPAELSEHFIHGMHVHMGLGAKPTNTAESELEFYQRIHGRGMMVHRDDAGAYIVLAVHPMHQAPRLIVRFNRDDLKIEIVPFEKAIQPTHKVRFWICDRGGKNKREDLRQHITSIELDAQL